MTLATTQEIVAELEEGAIQAAGMIPVEEVVAALATEAQDVIVWKLWRRSHRTGGPTESLADGEADEMGIETAIEVITPIATETEVVQDQANKVMWKIIVVVGEEIACPEQEWMMDQIVVVGRESHVTMADVIVVACQVVASRVVVV